MIIGAAYSALEEMRCKLSGPFSVEAIKNHSLLIYSMIIKLQYLWTSILPFSPWSCNDVVLMIN